MTDPSPKPNALARRVKQHIKGRHHNFFAVCHPGFEEITRAELEGLGISRFLEVTTGGILFTGIIEDCYRINFLARTITRLLLRITSFNVQNFSTFQAIMQEVPWELYLPLYSKLTFSITARKSRLHHTGRIEDECRKAITTRLGPFRDAMPATLNEGGSEQQIFLRLYRDRCTVSIDSSGELLYRRGQRMLINEAPLRETRAAAILQAAKFSRYRTIIDPMCGAGTFSIEAAAMAAEIPAGRDRSFAFQSWPVYSDASFSYMKRQGSEPRLENNKIPHIIASDIDEKSLEAARKNILCAELDKHVVLKQKDFFQNTADREYKLPGLLLLNPPYGKRLGDSDATPLYHRIGNTIEEYYQNFDFAIIVPGDDAEKALSLKYNQKIIFRQGNLPVAVLIRKSN